MANEENVNSNTSTEENEETEEDLDALKTKLTETEEKNKQLFERAKKAETELKIFRDKSETTEEKTSKKQKPDEKLLERLDNLALKTAGIKGEDEIELFEKWKTETGRESDSIIDSPIFNKELEDLRTARANQEATSNVKGEQGESGVKNTADYWIAKATKGADGKLLFSDETPKELYSQILDKISAGEPGSSEELKFYNK